MIFTFFLLLIFLKNSNSIKVTSILMNYYIVITMTGATTWMHEVRSVNSDAVCVSRLRSCGVIFVGKANMHELGMGTTGNNPNYGSVCCAGPSLFWDFSDFKHKL